MKTLLLVIVLALCGCRTPDARPYRVVYFDRDGRAWRCEMRRAPELDCGGLEWKGPSDD